MSKTQLIIGIVLLLVGIELTRRMGETAYCYVTLRYDPLFVVFDGSLFGECVERHLIWPFGL